MAAVAAPKICRERERKGREGRKEREKRRNKREREREREEKKERKGEEIKREICITPTPLELVKIIKDTKRGGLKKAKKAGREEEETAVV